MLVLHRAITNAGNHPKIALSRLRVRVRAPVALPNFLLTEVRVVGPTRKHSRFVPGD